MVRQRLKESHHGDFLRIAQAQVVPFGGVEVFLNLGLRPAALGQRIGLTNEAIGTHRLNIAGAGRR